MTEGLVELVNNPEAVLKQILFWTSGQPFLTQKICELVVKNGKEILAGNEAESIKQLVYNHIIETWRTQDHPQHLTTIEDRIIHSDRPDTLLQIYQQILQQDKIEIDDSPAQIELQLSGLIIKKQGKLRVNNPIYYNIFNRDWLSEKVANLRPYSAKFLAWKKIGRAHV